jgi:hypothetical protein
VSTGPAAPFAISKGVPDPDWDRHCADLGAEAVGEATGRDIWTELGGAPRSWREAAALYRRLGVRSLREAVTVVLGEPLAVTDALHGDIALVDGALGVVHGSWAVRCLDHWHPIWRAECVWKPR